MNEFEQAEAALAALRQAEYDEIAQREAAQAAIEEAERQAAEAEAALAESEAESEIEGMPMFDNDALQARLDELTLNSSDPNYVIGVDPFEPTNPPIMRSGYASIADPNQISSDSFTITTSTGTSDVTRGLWEEAQAIEGTSIASITISDLEEVVEDMIQEPTPVKIKKDKIDSSAYDAEGFLTIAEIKMELIPILDDLYPKRWSWDKLDHILIHFPAFTITNSKNARHDIKDLYIRLQYNHPNKVFSGGYDGARTSITKSELNGNYAHSHLPSITDTSVGAFSGFCLGRSTLSYLLSDLATLEMKEEKLEDIKLKFLLVLMEIENYLQWESLEGGPYRRMSNINSGNLSSIGHRNTSIEIRNIMSAIWHNIEKGIYKPQIKFNHKGLLEVINNDGFLEEISKYCEDEYLVHRDGAGKFYSERTASGLTLGRISNNNKFKFKGKFVYPTLIEDKIEYEESGKDFAHPQIVNGCRKQLQDSINASWASELAGKIISHYLSRERKIKNSRKSLFANIKNVRDSIET